MNRSVDELIGRAYHGRISDWDERWLSRWRAESPRNETYYADLTRLLALISELAEDPRLVPPPVSVLVSNSNRWARRHLYRLGRLLPGAGFARLTRFFAAVAAVWAVVFSDFTR